MTRRIPLLSHTVIHKSRFLKPVACCRKFARWWLVFVTLSEQKTNRQHAYSSSLQLRLGSEQDLPNLCKRKNHQYGILPNVDRFGSN